VLQIDAICAFDTRVHQALTFLKFAALTDHSIGQPWVWSRR